MIRNLRELGIELSKEGRTEDALFILQKAFDFDYKNAINDIGVVYERKGDYDRAFICYTDACKENVSIAFYNLGTLYERGLGVKQDYKMALSLYKASKKRGCTLAYVGLSNLYLNGLGVEKNERKAFLILSKGIKEGDTDTNDIALALGCFYENGVGTKVNLKKAFQYYKRAIESKTDFAYHNLGICYLNGVGTKKDINSAIECFVTAAVNGYADACIELHKIYKEDEAVKDIQLSNYWLDRAMQTKSIKALICYAESLLQTCEKNEENKEEASWAIATYLTSDEKEETALKNMYQELKKKYPDEINWEYIEGNPMSYIDKYFPELNAVC